MKVLILGLLIFLAVHSVRIIAEPWRTALIARLGQNGWKGLYSLLSILGVALIVWGYGLARGQPMILWTPPAWTHPIAALINIPAFIFIAAAYVPGNRFKATLGHPMVAGTQLWALAHLLANGTLPAVLLFGSFLIWSITDFASARRRDRVAGTRYPAGTLGRDAAVVVVGIASWALIAFLFHKWLAGVPVFM